MLSSAPLKLYVICTTELERTASKHGQDYYLGFAPTIIASNYKLGVNLNGKYLGCTTYMRTVLRKHHIIMSVSTSDFVIGGEGVSLSLIHI